MNVTCLLHSILHGIFLELEEMKVHLHANVNVSLFQNKVPTLVDFPSHCEFDYFVPT
mgnify:CR=1 FL=1